MLIDSNFYLTTISSRQYMLFSKVAKIVLYTGWLTYNMNGLITSPVGPTNGKLSLGIARAGPSLNGDC